MTTYVFDTETRRLASEVEAEYASELAGAKGFSRPDLSGFSCGVLVDAETGEAMRYGPDQAGEMIAKLSEVDVTAGYNSAAFDLPVLSAYGSVSAIRENHVDLCSAVWTSLANLAESEGIEHRLRQGGLDSVCKANGLEGKTGIGTDAPSLYREGRIEELLDYCEADVRLTADLYRRAVETGYLTVEPTYRDSSKNVVELGPQEVPVSLVPAGLR